jgi:hypothetical protein
VNVVEYREDEATEDILQELLQDADNAMQVDCAGPTVQFVVGGWFVFPLGSMRQQPKVTSAA